MSLFFIVHGWILPAQTSYFHLPGGHFPWNALIFTSVFPERINLTPLPLGSHSNTWRRKCLLGGLFSPDQLSPGFHDSLTLCLTHPQPTGLIWKLTHSEQPPSLPPNTQPLHWDHNFRCSPPNTGGFPPPSLWSLIATSCRQLPLRLQALKKPNKQNARPSEKK